MMVSAKELHEYEEDLCIIENRIASAYVQRPGFCGLSPATNPENVE